MSACNTAVLPDAFGPTMAVSPWLKGMNTGWGPKHRKPVTVTLSICIDDDPHPKTYGLLDTDCRNSHCLSMRPSSRSQFLSAILVDRPTTALLKVRGRPTVLRDRMPHFSGGRDPHRYPSASGVCRATCPDALPRPA